MNAANEKNIFFILSTNAQSRYSGKDRVNNLKERLSLSEQQTAKVDSILTFAMNKAAEISATGQERREAMRQIMTDANNQIENILTDSQKTEYEKMLSERRNRMHGRRNNLN